MSVLEGFWKGFGAILERFRSSKSIKKSITERIDFSSGFFINFWWVFERFLDTFSDGKTVRKSLSREGRFHPFFHSFFEVSHSKSKPCDPRSIRKFSYNSWGPAFQSNLIKVLKSNNNALENQAKIVAKSMPKSIKKLMIFSDGFSIDF